MFHVSCPWFSTPLLFSIVGSFSGKSLSEIIHSDFEFRDVFVLKVLCVKFWDLLSLILGDFISDK